MLGRCAVLSCVWCSLLWNGLSLWRPPPAAVKGLRSPATALPLQQLFKSIKNFAWPWPLPWVWRDWGVEGRESRDLSGRESKRLVGASQETVGARVGTTTRGIGPLVSCADTARSTGVRRAVQFMAVAGARNGVKGRDGRRRRADRCWGRAVVDKDASLCVRVCACVCLRVCVFKCACVRGGARKR